MLDFHSIKTYNTGCTYGVNAMRIVPLAADDLLLFFFQRTDFFFFFFLFFLFLPKFPFNNFVSDKKECWPLASKRIRVCDCAGAWASPMPLRFTLNFALWGRMGDFWGLITSIILEFPLLRISASSDAIVNFLLKQTPEATTAQVNRETLLNHRNVHQSHR